MTKYEKIINEVHQAVLGVKGTEDKGIVGDLKELKVYVRKQNGRIRKLELGGISLISLLIGLGILEWKDVTHLFGG